MQYHLYFALNTVIHRHVQQESQVKQYPKPHDLHKDLRPANTAPFLFRFAILECKFTMNTSGPRER